MSGWQLTARAVTESGSYEQVYTNKDVDSFEFARGFVVGYLAANGIPPELITLERQDL